MANHSSGRRLDSGKGVSNSGARKVDTSSSRRSTRDALSLGQMTSSPSSTRKSERLEKRTPPTPPTPPSATRKSQRLEKQSNPSPLRRSDRGKIHISSSSSGSRGSEKVSSSLGRLKKKEKEEKSVKQNDEESLLSLKRKRMNGHSYKALFKKQKRRYSAPDSHEKLERQDTLPPIDSVDSAASGSKLLEDQENGVHECGHSMIEDLREEPLGIATKNEDHSFVGNCTVCSKRRRLDYDSPEEELCSCGATPNWTSGDTSMLKVSGNVEAAFNSESIWGHKCTTQSKETLSGTEIESLKNVCAMCKKGGKLLCCDGESCKRYYHLSCLDPSLNDDPPGAWHCSYCVRKKIEFGVHIVSKGVESIWDVREVVEADMKGRQKQYLVKYQGLAHVYNHWVPERQLLHECPSLVAKFIQEHESVRWNPEWRLPHRLLRKRRLMSYSQQDEYQSLNANVIPGCQCEWLVKWRGLDYDQATWEIDSMDFLCSPRGQELVREYENRRQKAKKVSDKRSDGAPVKLPKLPGGSPITDDNLLNNVNKLREFWYKKQSAVIFDEQDRLVNVILFILSVSEYHQPFLVVTTSNALSQWEAEFMRLAPSIDIVVYNGNRDTRRSLRTLEFYDEGGGIMLQLLLSTLEIVIEDVQTLKGIKWEAVIVDECQYNNVISNVEPIKMLPTNMMLLLFSGQLKDVAEYQSLLSLLDSSGDLDKVGGLGSGPNDNLVKLKESLLHYVVYGSKFVEYWVPVPISDLQLEQYCSTLLSNTIALWSSLKKDSVGALLDILITVRKCCSHPYIVDASVQALLIKGLQAPEALNVGIKASGKLQLLDTILSKIRRRKLRVLVLFQSIAGPREISIGDILDDVLCQRFGKNSYERIDAHLATNKKQSAMDRFNSREGEQFVFLLENRACLPSIKLSVDFVVIYDSEWNPVNDMKALQKISIDSQSEQIKVFRLYSSYTFEEKVLILSKQHKNVENDLHKQTTGRATSDTLLMWGASCLFSRLDNYHAEKSSVSAADISSGQEWLLDDVVKDFMAKLLDNSMSNNEHDSIISKAFRSVGVYHTDCLLLGERELQLPDEERQTFWKKLLEGRNPRWKFLSGPTPRSRKRVQYAEHDEEGKKRHKVVDTCDSEFSFQPELEGRGQAVGSKAESSELAATSQSQSLAMPVACTLDEANKATNLFSQETFFSHDSDVAHPKQRTLSSEQKSLHTFLRAEMAKLCQILKLTKDVKHMVGKFLEYVMENHHVNKEPASILQAFQMSLCWIAASILKEKIDRMDCLTLAKQALDFQCTEEEVNSVYRKLRSLKRAFLQLPGNNNDPIPSKNVVSASEDITKQSPTAGEPPSASFNLQNVKVEVEERPLNLEPSWEHAIDESTANHRVRKIKKIQKKCDKHMLKLRLKQEEEIQEFHKMREKKRVQLEGEHKLDLAFIRTTYSQSAMRMDKLKMSVCVFEKIIQEHECLMEVQLKELEARHAAAREEESKRIADWLAKMKSCISQCRDVGEFCIHGSESNYEVGFSVNSGRVTSQPLENEVPRSGPEVGEQNPDRIVHVNQASEMIISEASVTGADDAFGSTVYSETLPIPVNSGRVTSQPLENEVPRSGPEVGEQNPDRIVHVTQASEMIISETSVTGADDAFGSTVHSETLPIPVNSVFSVEPFGIVQTEASSVAGVEQPKESSQTSNTTPDINVQLDTVGCSIPAERSPVLLNSISDKELEIVAVETSSVARVDQQKEACPLSNMAQEITPNCSFHGMEESASINLASSKEQNTDEISSSGQNNEIPSGDPSTVGCEIGNACTVEVGAGVDLNTEHSSGNSMGSDVMGNQKGGTDGPMCESIPSPRLQSVDQISVPTVPSSKLPRDECLANIESIGMQDEDAPVTGNRTTSVGFASSTPVVAECSVKSNHEAQVVENSDQLQPASDSSSSVCSQPTAAEVVPHGHIEGQNSLQISVASPQLVEGSMKVSHHAAAQNDGESLVHPASDCLSPVCHQFTAKPVPQVHIERSNSPQTSEASHQLVDGSVELSHQAVSQNGENYVQPASDCLSPVYIRHTDAAPVHQVHIEGGNTLQTSEASSQLVEGSLELSHQAVSQIGENLVLPPLTEGIDSGHYQNHFDLRTLRTDHEPNGGLATVCQNIVASTQAVENADELPNQAPQQLGPNLAMPQGPTHLLMQQSNRVASWSPTLPLHAEPLQNELERIRKELEQSIVLHDNTKSQLKSECEKEIEEMIAQIRGKYDAKLKDAESAFLLKKTELDLNHKKVLMNKILAEAFRSKCLDLRSSRSTAMQQAASSSLTQHRHQFSLQPTLRHPSAGTPSSASQSAVSQQIAIPPVQSLHRSPGLFPSVPARPPQISAITPSIGGLRVGGEIRAPAPHLQPFRPPACTSGASISCLPCTVPGQQVPVNLPATSVSLPSVLTQQPLQSPSQVSLQQNPPPPPPPPTPLAALPPSRCYRPSQSESEVQMGRHNPTLSAVELLMDVDNQAVGHLPNILQHLAGSGLNTNALDPSITRASGKVNSSVTTPVIASDVVCLSDDED